VRVEHDQLFAEHRAQTTSERHFARNRSAEGARADLEPVSGRDAQELVEQSSGVHQPILLANWPLAEATYGNAANP